MGDFLEPGTKAPDFTLPADDGSKISLRQFRGKPVVLYFYPRDNTPGCTKEAQAFRDRHAAFVKRGAIVLGVSPDDLDSHAGFRDRHGLNFRLLSDVDHRVAEQYGAWREKTRFGKKSMGIQRSTYLIDAQGVIRKVWKRVSVDGHDAQVLGALEQLEPSAAKQ